MIWPLLAMGSLVLYCIAVVWETGTAFKKLRARHEERSKLLREAAEVPCLPGDLRAKIMVELGRGKG